MSVKVRNTPKASPLRRKDYSLVIPDFGSASVAVDSLNDILVAVPDPKGNEVFVVDFAALGAAEVGGADAADKVVLDKVKSGAGGTTMLSTKPEVGYHASATAPLYSQDGGNGETAGVLSTTAGACEVAAGAGLYIDLDITGDTTPFGTITVLLSGYFKDEHT